MKVIHLLRKPCSEGTVAANVLRHGTGAMNIDGCRVDGRPRTTHADGNYSGAKSRIGDDASGMWSNAFGGGLKITKNETPSGRWPANLVLQHLDGCHMVGVHGGGHGFRQANSSGSDRHDGRESYRLRLGVQEAPKGREGEVVPEWKCEPGCPVAALDAQSGTGGASRYFKQFTTPSGCKP